MPDLDGEFKDGIGARLLTDLRQIDKLMPGMFTMPTIDNKSPERMWLRYQPFENQPYRESYTAPLRRQPWVVGVDCASGEIKISVNIANAPGLDPGAAHKNAIGNVDHYSGFMSQTDEMILTTVNWPGMNHRSAKVRDTGVLIRKNDGGLVGLNPQTTIAELTDLVNGTMYGFGAVAVGNEFITAQKTGDPDKFYSSERDEPKRLVRISPTGTVNPITVTGRRPQLSPFDPIDRSPQMIVPDGGRVMVVHDWDYVARYTPKDGSWQLSEGQAKTNRDIATRVVTADFQKHIFSRHKIPKSEKSPELIVKWEETLPDQLTVFKGGKGECRIKINLVIPENFAKQPVFGDWIKDSDKKKDGPSDYWTYESRKGSEAYHLVVLSQTKTDLILALQIGRGFHWSPGKHTGEYLPLLWALSIEELHAAIMAQK